MTTRLVLECVVTIESQWSRRNRRASHRFACEPCNVRGGWVSTHEAAKAGGEAHVLAASNRTESM